MKKLIAILFVVALIFTSAPIDSAYAAGEYKDTVIDQVGDWFATLGKEGVEKDQILAKRKADRMKKWAEKKAAEAKKEMGKAGKDMKKKFGM